MKNDVLATATCISDPQSRLLFLPKHFGQYCMTFKDLACNWMRQLSSENDKSYPARSIDRLTAHYDGGEWDYFELSNGGIFIKPSGRKNYRISASGNYFDELVSAESAGIIVTYFTLGQLCNLPVMFSERCAAFYHKLTEYAGALDEYPLIRAAID